MGISLDVRLNNEGRSFASAVFSSLRKFKDGEIEKARIIFNLSISSLHSPPSGILMKMKRCPR